MVWRGLERRTGLEDGSDKVANRGDEEDEESVEAASLLRARRPYVRLTLGVVVCPSVVGAALRTEAVIVSAHHAGRAGEAGVRPHETDGVFSDAGELDSGFRAPYVRLTTGRALLGVRESDVSESACSLPLEQSDSPVRHSE